MAKLWTPPPNFQPTRPKELEHRPGKTVGTKAIDAAQGIVEALVSVSGNTDEHGDVVQPGATNIGLQFVRPKCVWSHDWNTWLGKSLEVGELLPGDPRLPAELREQGLGGMRVVTQFNMEKQVARDAMSDLLFFGDEVEWSVGYEVLAAEPLQLDDEDGDGMAPTLRLITAWIVWEYSPVLFGANRLTQTLSAKSIGSIASAVKGAEEPDRAVREVIHALGFKVADEDEEPSPAEQKVGRVLSAGNRKALSDAVKLIQGVLDSDGGEEDAAPSAGGESKGGEPDSESPDEPDAATDDESSGAEEQRAEDEESVAKGVSFEDWERQVAEFRELVAGVGTSLSTSDQ